MSLLIFQFVNFKTKRLGTETFLNWQKQVDPAEVVQRKGRLKVIGKFHSRYFHL